jgi:hypothetical protein
MKKEEDQDKEVMNNYLNGPSLKNINNIFSEKKNSL